MKPETLSVSGRDRITVFHQILSRYPGNRTAIDLGAGHCQFAIAAAKAGLQVVAIDARTERVPFRILPEFNITFVHDDINRHAFDATQFDIVLMLGIVYHLTLDEQIALLGRCSTRLTIVDTHYSLEPTLRMDGYVGHLYAEDRRSHRSSLSSPVSFWHTPDSLLRLFHEAGYRRVLKVEPELNPANRRSFYVCEP